MAAASVDELFGKMREILADVIEDWDIDVNEINLNTRLLDIGMESISLVYLIAELQQSYGLGDQLFRKMRNEGTLLVDMTVGNILTSMSSLMQAKGASVS